MAALAWCGLLTKTPSDGAQLKLDDVKGTCERFMAYCSKIESFSMLISITEMVGSAVVFTWSCLRCNPVLLKLIVGSMANRKQQPSLVPVFDTAKALRGPLNGSVFEHGPALLFHVVGAVNIAILSLDMMYSIYLWVKIRREVLFLHFESQHIASVEVRNIMISLAVSPMSAFCVSRWSFLNQYIASRRLNDALRSAALAIKETADATEREAEQEALFVLDDSLAKSKPFDMKDMEDVLELMLPSFVAWNANVYLMTAGLRYLYFYAALFVVATALVIWHKFSKNIGLITPILLPLSCVGLEFVGFVFVGTLSLIWHHQSAVAALLIAPLIGLSLWSLCWTRTGTLKKE